jgi:hypothetical protein
MPMLLARIITRSQVCARELALDLLARGYTVEIVSPDKVPDNSADLELRVDAGPGDQLIANVEARDGERAASLRFVHHLKAPVADLLNLPPEHSGAVSSSEPIGFNVGSDIDEVELPAENPQLAATSVSPLIEVLPNCELDSGINPTECARLEPPQANPIIPLTVAARRPDRSPGWRWAALSFASLVLLVVVLGLSMRWISGAAAQSSVDRPVETIAAASIGVNPLLAVGAEENPTGALGQVSAVLLPPRTVVSRERGDGLVARDTVTYLDKRFEPTQKTKPPKPHPRGGVRNRTPRGGGVIAANTVIYFTKAAPKDAK